VKQRAASAERRDHWPVHAVPLAIRNRKGWTIRIDGLVARPLTLRSADLARLPRREIQEPFRCEEGWQVDGLRWRGIKLFDVLALAGPFIDAAYVRASSDSYAVSVPVADAESAPLCGELNGESLPIEHGGPRRLVVPGKECFTSVKWVDCLELTAEPGGQTGEQIARARLMR
jgi:DMSO/TMAO reductase YedYZ molybdopterin-dependent catalytic subunit